jgi:hypothetical protein
VVVPCVSAALRLAAQPPPGLLGCVGLVGFGGLGEGQARDDPERAIHRGLGVLQVPRVLIVARVDRACLGALALDDRADR